MTDAMEPANDNGWRGVASLVFPFVRSLMPVLLR